MANGGNIRYSVNFDVNKTGLNEIKASLQEIQRLTAQDLMKINNTSLSVAQQDLEKLKVSVKQLDGALDKAFNSDLGTLNVSKFNQELKKLNLNQIYKDFSNAGAAGQAAFRNTTTQILTTNMQLKQTHNLLDNMATTMANTIKWGVASSVMNSFTGSVQQAYGYVKSLDSSLNDIRIVTGYSAEAMDKFAVKANKAAKALGQSTTDYTEASLIYYQQGLSDKEVEARAETTLKAANVTGQSGQEVSEQLTAVWNGYKVTAEEAELYVDKLAAVAASTASDLEELSTGMSKVASAANAMGVDVNQLNAQLATIVSVTRQAPESVGTALKTIYARMSDLKMGETDEDELGLGDVSGTMEQMGIKILDETGNLRDMGKVVEDVAAKWDTWTKAQKTAMAQVMAGKRQYNNLVALFENWDMYEEALNTSENSMGTLQKQQDIYMESMKAHLSQLKTSTEDLYDSLLDPEGLNPLIDGLTNVVDLLGNFVDSIGGGAGVLLLLGVTATKVFNQQLSSGIATFIMNMQAAKENAAQLSAEMAILNQFDNANINDARTQQLIAMKREVLNLDKAITNEERNIANEYINQQNTLFQQQDELNNRLNQASELYAQLTGVSIDANSKAGQDSLLFGLKEELSDIDGLKTNITDTADAFNKLGAATREYNNIRKNATADEDTLTEAKKKYNAVLKEQGENIGRQIDSAKELILSDRLQAKERDHLSVAITNYNKVCQEQKTTSLDNVQVFNAAKKVQEAYKVAVNDTSKNIKTNIDNLNNHSKAIEDAKIKTDNLRTSWSQFISQINLRASVQQVMSLVSSIGQVAMGINTLHRLGSIVSNEDLSTGEKVLQITMNLSMGLPMLANGIIKTISGFKTLTASLKEYLAISQLKNLETLKDINFTGIKTTKDAMALVLQEAGVELSKKELKTLNLKTASEILNQKVKSGTITLEQKELVLKQLKSIADTKEQVSLLKTIGLYLKKAILMAGPYAIAAAAMIALIYAAVKAQNAEAEAAARASKNLENLTNRYGELTEAVKDFKDEVSNYDEAIEALKDLEKGTSEYKDKLEEANQSAKDLIETYKLFDNYDIDDKTGLIVFEDGVLEKTQAQLEKQAAQVGMNKAAAQVHSTNANLDVDISNLRDKSFGYLTKVDEGAVQYASDEDMKEIINIVASKLDENKNVQDLSQISAAIQSQMGFNGTDLFLETYKEDIFELAKASKEAASSNQYYAKEVVKNAMTVTGASKQISLAAADFVDTKGNLYSKEGREEALANAITGQVAAEVADIEAKKVYGNGSLNRKYDYDIKNDEDLAREYAKTVLGYTKEEVDKMEYQRGWGKGGLTLDGETILKKEKDNDKMMREALANAAEIQEVTTEILEADGSKLIETFDAVAEKTDQLAKGAGTSITNEILNAIGNQEEMDLSDTFAMMSPWENEALKEATAGKTADELKELLGLTDELISTMGYESAEEFKEAFDNQLASYSGEDGKGPGKEAYEAAEIDKINQDAADEDLDTTELNEYAKTLQETADESELLDDSLSENAVAAQQVAKQIMKLNRGVETLSDNWEDWGDILEKSDEGSQEYSEALQGTKEALADLADTSTDYISNDFIAEHLDEIKKAAEGDADAIDNLRIALGQEVVAKIALENGLTDAEITSLNENWNNLSSQLQDIDVGVTLSGENELIESLNAMILAAGMTSTQVNDLLGTMGFSATFAQEPQTVTTKVPQYTTYHEPEITGTVTFGEGEAAVTLPVYHERTWTEQSGFKDMSTEAAAFAMATAPQGENAVPKIETLTRSSSGATNNHSSSNKGGKSGKGGGGGGKGSGSKPKKVDKIESKKDRYHDVNVKLKQIDEDLEDIGRDQEKLFGADLLDSLNKELDILEKQRDVLQDKLDIAKDEQAELQKSLKAEGVEFNKDGTIKNYMEIMTAKENALNAMIDKYNHMSAADQEKYQETLDNAKEEYEKFVEMLGNYDDLLLETIPEIENTIQDITDREIEIQIQKLNMEVELRLDLTEAQKEWNEFKREVINGVDSDDIFGNALADADLFSEILQNGTMEALTNNINNTMDQIKSINETGTSSIFGDDKQAALDNLDEQMSNLMDHMSELTDLQKQISEAYLDMIDEVGEAFDEQIESYEYVGDLINHNMNMIKLVNGEDAYAEMAQVYKEQKENNLSIMQSQKAAVDYYRQMMETETDPEAVEKWTELWKGAVEDLNSTVEDSVEWIIEEYGNAVNEIFDRLDDKMTNGKGLDYLTQEWELKNENADQYLDTINSTYEIQKLERKIQDSINNTDSLSAQKKLNDFMDEELEMLREKEKLTQYDVDRANALYEVKLKEIALEEAQQNKSQMRLRRDASGNYSYQFVADQDSISKAQQELDDARNSLYNMDKDEYRENQQEILDVYTEFQEKMREAANLSAEEKELIEQQYNERINALLEENGYIRTNLMESAFADLAALYGSDIANFQQMSMEEQDILMGQIVPNWDSGIQDMIDTMTNPETGFGPMCKLAMEELDLATQEYNESLAMIKQTSEDSFGAAQEGYTTNIELARELAEAQQTNIDRTKEEKDAIGELKLEVDNLVQSYKDAYTAAKDALTAAQKLREYEAEQAAKEAAKNNPGGSGGSGDGDKGSKGDTGGKDGGNGGGKTRLTSEIIDGVAGAIWYWSPSAWGTGNERKQKMESKFGAGAYNTIQSYINDHVTVGGKMKKSFNYGWGERNKYKNYYYSKFDTGGYTGDWPGSDGRMAMLHKKELVLNADDTKNFLSAINLVRDMESMLAAMNDSMLSRTSGMTASLAPSLGFDDAASNTVNQNVSIQASFPGVSSRAEIEEAFQNLVNIASQHAFNTQR